MACSLPCAVLDSTCCLDSGLVSQFEMLAQIANIGLARNTYVERSNIHGVCDLDAGTPYPSTRPSGGSMRVRDLRPWYPVVQWRSESMAGLA